MGDVERVKDRSIGGFVAACVVELVAAWLARRAGIQPGLWGQMVPGMLAYFAYTWLMNSDDGEVLWTGMDLFTALMAALIANGVAFLFIH